MPQNQALTVIYGGTFDPPHVAHVLTVAWLLSALDAEVWVEPVDRHVLGKRPTDFATRKRWCELAFGIFGPRLQVRTDEQRPDASGATIDLLRHLKNLHPQRHFRLAIGSDILAERHQWRDFPGVMALAPLIVLPRPGYPIPAEFQAFAAPLLLPEVSSSSLRKATGEQQRGLIPHAVLEAMAAEGKVVE